MESTPQRIGDRIRTARQGVRISQEALATKVGTSRRRVIAWEKNENQPNVRYLRRVAEACNVTVETLLGEGDDDEEAALLDPMVADLVARIHAIAEEAVREAMTARERAAAHS